MCEYCDFDHEQFEEQALLGEFSTSDGTLIDGLCIMRPTPISKRCNPDKPAALVSNDFNIPIAYCPICGRKL